jgi:hypothetical protein
VVVTSFETAASACWTLTASLSDQVKFIATETHFVVIIIFCQYLLGLGGKAAAAIQSLRVKLFLFPGQVFCALMQQFQR